MTLLACTRMYNVNSAVTTHWQALVSLVAQRAGTPLDFIRHAPPASLSSLWARPDLGLAFMCGWPWSRAKPRPQPVAVPVTVDGGGATAQYASSLVVPAASRAASLADTFGGRLGWTVQDSHSGFNALRHHLLTHHPDARFGETAGPLVTPRAVVKALGDGRIDIGPLDSYWHWLLARHEPSTASTVRTVERTAPAPAPLLIASPQVASSVADALRQVLVGLADDAAGRAQLEPLGIARFAPVVVNDYALAERWHRDALAAGLAIGDVARVIRPPGVTASGDGV